jgi:alkanesulfonate monooxygenase SsuD/methylene tetrahydromethanopterin reductase-like flavin-dependent oxidoreductase (luciferase family)
MIAVAKPKLRFGVVYDFRNPVGSGMTHPALYAAILDQVAWLDRLGLDLVWFTEHHFVEDGYLPSWIPVASAMAARTRHVRFSCDVCLLPFNHPLRLAEDLAVLDNISNGRVEIGVGMGYAPHEFRGFGLPVSRRVSLTEEGLEVLRRAFIGETFSFAGKRYHFENVKVAPGYVQTGGPPLWIAAMAEPGAERAARFNANLLPQGPRNRTLDHWRARVQATGGEPDAFRIGIIRSCLVTDDPDRDWAAVRSAERRRMEVYNRFRAEAGGHGGVAGITEETRIPQTWIVGDAAHCVAELTRFIREYGLTDIVTWGVPPRADGTEPRALRARCGAASEVGDRRLDRTACNQRRTTREEILEIGSCGHHLDDDERGTLTQPVCYARGEDRVRIGRVPISGIRPDRSGGAVGGFGARASSFASGPSRGKRGSGTLWELCAPHCGVILVGRRRDTRGEFPALTFVPNLVRRMV